MGAIIGGCGVSNAGELNRDGTALTYGGCNVSGSEVFVNPLHRHDEVAKCYLKALGAATAHHDPLLLEVLAAGLVEKRDEVKRLNPAALDFEVRKGHPLEEDRRILRALSEALTGRGFYAFVIYDLLTNRPDAPCYTTLRHKLGHLGDDVKAFDAHMPPNIARHCAPVKGFRDGEGAEPSRARRPAAVA